MKLKKSFAKIILGTLFCGSIVVTFQNCSNQGFDALSSQHLPNLNFQQMNSLANANVSTSPNSSISAKVYGSQLTISTSARLAGAIGSLTWNGIEFINQDDHGRELQSASSFDGLGECFNPTEAGSGPVPPVQ